MLDRIVIFIFSLGVAFVASASDLISIGAGGEMAQRKIESYSSSSDGSKVIFLSRDQVLDSSKTDSLRSLYMRDIEAGTTEIVGLGNEVMGELVMPDADILEAKISGDGNYIVFLTAATNLSTNNFNCAQVYRREIATGIVERISEDGGGNAHNSASGCLTISSDGDEIGYCTSASNIGSGSIYDKYFIHQYSTSTKIEVTPTSEAGGLVGDVLSADMAPNGGKIVFSTNAVNIDPLDPSLGTTEEPLLNAEFDIYSFNYSSYPTVSFDLVSKVSPTEKINGHSVNPKLSLSGNTLAFESIGNNILVGDNNDRWDVYKLDVVAGVFYRESVTNAGGEFSQDSELMSLSDDGTEVIFKTKSGINGNFGTVENMYSRYGTHTLSLMSDGITTIYDDVGLGGINGNGRFRFYLTEYAFDGGDTNGVADLYRVLDPYKIDSIMLSGGGDVEEGQTLTYTVTRTNARSNFNRDVLINYQISGEATSGDDYLAVSGTVLIAEGQDSATIQIQTVDDVLLESPESITIEILGGEFYSAGIQSITDTISDNDIASVSLTLSQSIVPENSAQVVNVTAGRVEAENGFPLQFDLVVTGTATSGEDYIVDTLSIEIPAGVDEAVAQIIMVNDNVPEGTENIEISIDETSQIVQSGPNAILTIEDADLHEVSIVAIDSKMSEDGVDTAVFELRRDFTFGAVDVALSYLGSSVYGLDYVAAPLSVTIPDGQASAQFTITGSSDLINEPTETLIAKINEGSGYLLKAPTQALAIIEDASSRQIVSLESGNLDIPETGTGTLTIKKSDNGPSVDVYLVVSGTAQSGVDFQAVSTPVTVPAGAESVDVTITAIDDAISEGAETIKISVLSGSNYTADVLKGEITFNVIDNDSSVLELYEVSGKAREGQDDRKLSFEIRATGDVRSDIEVDLGYGGDAAFGVDYLAPTSITFEAGQNSKVIEIEALTDTEVEFGEIINVSLVNNGNYQLGTYPAVNLRITDGKSELAEVNDSVSEVSVANDGSVALASSSGKIYAGNSSALSEILGHNSQSLNGRSKSVSITSDGGKVYFQSIANNFSSGPSGIFQWNVIEFDRAGNSFTNITAATISDINNESINPSISPNGDYLVFESNSPDLVSEDTNSKRDIFSFDTSSSTLNRVSDLSSDPNFTAAYLPKVDNGGNVSFFTDSDLVFVDSALDETTVSGIERPDSYSILGTSILAMTDQSVFDVNEDKIYYPSTFEKLVEIDSVAVESKIDISKLDGKTVNLSTSSNGRFAVFLSQSRLLDPRGDTCGVTPFIADLSTGDAERLEYEESASCGDYSFSAVSISADGRRIAYSKVFESSGKLTSKIYETSNPYFSF
jgi:hypothetical protein